MKTQFIGRTALLAVDLALVEPGMNATERIADQLSEFLASRFATMEHETTLRDRSANAQRLDRTGSDRRHPQLGTPPHRSEASAEVMKADHDGTKGAQSRTIGEGEVVDNGAGQRRESDDVK